MLNKLLSRMSHPFNHSPATGDRKEVLPMPDPTPQQNAPAPQNPPAPQAAPDVTAHLAALADAMRQLAESQKTLAQLVKPPAPQAPPLAASPSSPAPDISGDPIGGASPAALSAIDYSKLSPLQQITLGLRDAGRTTAPRAGAD